MSEFKDLGLSYEEAAHGVQTAIAFSALDISMPVRMCLGISKGIFTIDEYMKTMRLAANTELFMHEKKAKSRGIDINFR
jgi:hypothetical protein